MPVIQKIRMAFLMLCLFSCAGLQFSQQSLIDTEQVTDAAITLLGKSNNPFSQHSTEVEKLKQQVQEIYRKEQLRKMNVATISMWSEVMNGDGNLFALLDLWKSNGTLSPAMRVESVRKIERLLNSIYDLEMHKKS